MRKLLFLLLLLAPVLALNVTVSCTGPCLAYVPAGGNAVLNYSVNGALLDDVFTKAFLVNVSGDDSNEGLVTFNLTQYSCENPAAAFLDGSLNGSLEAAYFDDLLLASVNLSSTNSTVKLFCSGFNTERVQASWYGYGGVPLYSRVNMTYNGSMAVVSGLTLIAEKTLELNETREVEMGRNSFVVANVSSQLELTLYNKSMDLLGSLNLPEASYVYMDYGNLTGDDSFFYVVSHGIGATGNITILNETLAVNGTLQFNGTGGVAIADVDGDGENEIVACANDTELNMTVLEFTGSGWTYSQKNISCSGFEKFESMNFPSLNETIITRVSSGNLRRINFNGTAFNAISVNCSDFTTLDVDSDGDQELIVLLTDGDVKIYNVTSELFFTEIDYLGNWADAKLDAHDELLVENGTLELFSLSPLARTALLSYLFPKSIPAKIELNFSVGGTGNVTLNATLGEWYHEQTFSSAQDVYLELYPGVNETLWVNFTLSAVNSTVEPWVAVNNISLHFANLSYVNYSNYSLYSPAAISINTSISAGGSWNLLGADFKSPFSLDYFLVYIPGGNYSFRLDGSPAAATLSKPSISSTAYSYWFHSTGAVQGSQNEGNFSAVVGFADSFHLVEQDVNVTAYGPVGDYCSLGNYILYTWENATLLRWDGSLTEVANVTGNFSECWLNGTHVFLVNSTGGVSIYNYSLAKKDGFGNSSFLVQDVAAPGPMYFWNGTQLATRGAGNEFSVVKDWNSEIFISKLVYHETESVETVSAPTGDVDGDSLWEKFSSGVFSLVTNIARLLTLPSGSYSSLEKNVSVALDNGTIRTYGLNLSTPRMGWFTIFWTNATSGSGWIATNTSETFRINLTVTGFLYNDTDTLNDFRMECGNGTYTKNLGLTKYAGHKFTLVTAENSSWGAKRACIIYPYWAGVEMPLTFPSYGFTMYVDSQWPAINSVSAPAYISSTKAFNLTVNVTEDSEINQFKVYINHSSFVPSVSGFTLQQNGTYQIYTVTLAITDAVGLPPTRIYANITARDYTGKVSSNHSAGSMIVYDLAAPDNEIVNTAPSNNIQDFASVPLNMSIHALSNDDANISWMNVSLWQGSNLQTYVQATGVNYPNKTLWLNSSLSGYNESYIVQITSVDITGNRRDSSMGVLRHGSQFITVNGKWFSSTTGSIKVYWENTFTSGSGLRSSQQITDTQTGTNETTGESFSRKIETPDVPVDQWYVQANVSSWNLKYIRMKYTDSVPSDVSTYVYAATNVYGINTTDVPDSLIIRGERTIGSTEKMCLKICEEFDIVDGTCDSSWIEDKCASAGLDAYSFVISGSDDLLDKLDTETGTGFWIDAVAISSDTADDTTDTQTTTGLVGTAVVTITAPTSKSVNVDDCVDVTYTIKNTGSAWATISDITVTGFSTSEMTYTMLSDIDFPYSLGINKQLQAILSFCPLTAKQFNPSVCAKIGSSSKCVTVKITALGESGTGGEEGALNLTVTVETFEDEYIVLVNSSRGALEGVVVTITYSDGTAENYTTNVFGKINFVPKLKDFTVKVNYEGETIEKDISELTEPLGLTLWRILVDLLIIGVLIGFGVLLDEKML